MQAKRRFEEIDIAKGIGILLVVIGHCFPDVSTASGISVPAFRIIHDVIYTFHMPLMFFLAGFLAQRISRLRTVSDKVSFSKDRFIRLMIPYFVIGLLYMPVKMILSRFAAQPFDIKNLWQIFFGENPDGGLWYLYDLFLIQGFLALVCTRKNVILILPINAIISVLIVVFGVSFFWIDDAIYYLLFVVLGVLTGPSYGNSGKFLNGVNTVIATASFGICVYFCLQYGITVLWNCWHYSCIRTQ